MKAFYGDLCKKKVMNEVIFVVSYIVVGILVSALAYELIGLEEDDEGGLLAFFAALCWPITVLLLLHACCENYFDVRKNVIPKIRKNQKVFDTAVSLLEELPLESFDVIEKDNLKIHDDQVKNKVLLSLVELSDSYRLSYVGVEFIFHKSVFLRKYCKLFKKRLEEARQTLSTDGQDAEEVANKLREKFLKY